jgi:hypothetical protein
MKVINIHLSPNCEYKGKQSRLVRIKIYLTGNYRKRVFIAKTNLLLQFRETVTV